MYADDYNITVPYGRVPGYELNGGVHRGVDRPCPYGTWLMVNGMHIADTGNTGAVFPAPTAQYPKRGAHLHITRMVGGVSVDPGAGGFDLPGAVVQATGEDAVNGKYVKLAHATGLWIYCHLSGIVVTRGQTVAGGGRGAGTPTTNNQGAISIMADENFVRAFFIDLFNVNPTPEQLRTYVGRPVLEVYNELRNAPPRAERVAYIQRLEALAAAGNGSTAMDAETRSLLASLLVPAVKLAAKLGIR